MTQPQPTDDETMNDNNALLKNNSELFKFADSVSWHIENEIKRMPDDSLRASMKNEVEELLKRSLEWKNVSDSMMKHTRFSRSHIAHLYQDTVESIRNYYDMKSRMAKSIEEQRDWLLNKLDERFREI